MYFLPERIRLREAERVAEWISDEFYESLPHEVKEEDGGRTAERLAEEVWESAHEAVFHALADVRTKWPL